MDNKPKIFKDNLHLKLTRYFLTGLGVWPLEFVAYPFLKKLYKIYSKFIYIYNFMFICTQFIEIFFLFRARNINRLMQNLSLSLLTTISIFRTTVVKGKLSRTIIKTIYDIEDNIMSSNDEEIKKIYLSYARLSHLACKFFIIVGYVTSVPFFFEPMAEELAHPDLYYPSNGTGATRLLPLSSWYPYDTNNYYKLTFCWQIFSAFIIEGFVVYTDTFMFSLIIFSCGQMKILQHIIRNFKTYKRRVATNLNLPADLAAKTTMRSIIMMHKNIIQYVDEIDQALRTTLLLDFMSCSLQMSVILLQTIMFEFGIPMIHAAEFLLSMIIQLFLFHWNANEIIVESLGIAKSIWESEWYEENKEVKQSMHIMMIRSQKPLTLSIGPFYRMSIDTAIAVLKASYSYGMLLRQSYIMKN